jgi:hypothetical protein
MPYAFLPLRPVPYALRLMFSLARLRIRHAAGAPWPVGNNGKVMVGPIALKQAAVSSQPAALLSSASARNSSIP